MDYLLSQINSFQLLLIILLSQFLLTGDINKGSKHCIFLFYVYNVLECGQMVLRIADPLSMDILMGVEYPLEIHRINKFIQIHLKRL